MSCGTPLCVFKPLLIVAGIAALGMGGYNLATTGCPLGTCDTPEQSTALTAISDSGAAKSDCGSYPRETGIETTQLVSLDETTPEASQCSDAMKAACETMGECPDGMMENCGDAADCPMGAAKTQMAADHCEGGTGDCPMGAAKTKMVAEQRDGMDPADCKKACDMPATPGQTADADQAETKTETGEG